MRKLTFVAVAAAAIALVTSSVAEAQYPYGTASYYTGPAGGYAPAYYGRATYYAPAYYAPAYAPVVNYSAYSPPMYIYYNNPSSFSTPGRAWAAWDHWDRIHGYGIR
jgi:hypothetical protein